MEFLHDVLSRHLPPFPRAPKYKQSPLHRLAEGFGQLLGELNGGVEAVSEYKFLTTFSVVLIEVPALGDEIVCPTLPEAY